MDYRNESPPPEYMDEIGYDVVSNTAYSKLGLIELTKKILNKLVNYCSLDSIDVENDLEFDDDLCKFMDMTVEPTVLEFISDFAFIEPFCHAICFNKSDRFNELFIGILSNFASNESLCKMMTEDVNILELLLSFWSSSNSAFLLECTRLLKLAVRHTSCTSAWLQAIRRNQNYLENILFVLNASKNSDLLISTVQVVGQIMKSDDEICDRWICPELLSAVLIARNEAEWYSDNNIDYFHYVIHLFSTVENGVVILMSNLHLIYHTFSEYLNRVCDEEPHLILISQYQNSLRLILPTIDVLISNMDEIEALDMIQSDPSVLENLVKLVFSCSLQADASTVQEVYLEISSFFNTIINITYSSLDEINGNSSHRIKWLQSIDVGSCLPQLQAFLTCCTQNEKTKSKLMEITHTLNYTYLYEALADVKIK